MPIENGVCTGPEHSAAWWPPSSSPRCSTKLWPQPFEPPCRRCVCIHVGLPAPDSGWLCSSLPPGLALTVLGEEALCLVSDLGI